MASRSLNKVQLIGNLTRDPELRYTPQGTAVCAFGLATNRSWSTEGGEKREETEFHRVVAWNKLAELCSQLLFKGRKVYVEGRLQTRSWTGQDGSQRQATEVVIEEMIILDSRQQTPEGAEDTPVKIAEEPAIETPSGDETPPVAAPTTEPAPEPVEEKPAKKTKATTKEPQKVKEEPKKEETASDDLTNDIPF